MLSKEFIKFAIPFLYDDTEWPCELTEAIEAEIAAAVKAEREACAKIATDRAAVCKAAYDAGDKTGVHPQNEALHIAQLIEARNRIPEPRGRIAGDDGIDYDLY